MDRHQSMTQDDPIRMAEEYRSLLADRIRHIDAEEYDRAFEVECDLRDLGAAMAATILERPTSSETS